MYRDSVADAGNGFAAMSMTRAKKEILGMSEEDIRVDLEQQRMEKAAAAEMEQTSNIIKKTGVFDRVDALYGEFGGSTSEGDTEGGAEGGDEFAAGGGGGGGFGGGLEGGDEFADDGLGGEEGSLGTEEPSVGGEELSAEPAAEPAAEIPMESHNKKGDLLVETEIRKRKLDIRTKKYQNIFTNRLIFHEHPS